MEIFVIFLLKKRSKIVVMYDGTRGDRLVTGPMVRAVGFFREGAASLPVRSF
jgi:hypothetical protein